jgi:hypothetical protein
VDVIVDDLGAEAFGVRLHAIHECGTEQAMRIARPVVDLGGGHELATLLDAGDQHGFAVRASGIHRRGIAGGAGT